MEKNFKNKLSYILLGSSILVTFIGIFALNYYFPLYHDDWIYSFVFGPKDVRLGGFLDIVESQYVHYLTWGGRNVAHAIAQTFLYLGEHVGDFINSLGYLALVVTIYQICNRGRKVNPLLFILISALIWLIVPNFMISAVWLTGSANYLWGGLFVIGFSYIYYTLYLGTNVPEEKSRSVSRCILIFLFGVIAGWTNENLVVGLIFFIFCVFILLKLEKRKIPLWAIIGAVGAIVGALIMLSSPGNYIRNTLELEEIHGITKDNFEYSYYFYRLVSVIYNYFEYGLVATFMYITTFLLHLKFGKKENKKRRIIASILFFLMGVVSTLIMAASPSFPDRVWFSILVCIIIAALLLWANLDFPKNQYRIVFNIVELCVIGFFAVSYAYSLSDVVRLRKVFDHREKVISEGKKNGIKDYVFYDRFQPKDRCVFTQKVYDIYHMENKLWEMKYSHFYEINSIVINDPATK